MKAYRYMVEVYDSAFDQYTHMYKHLIVEFWIPERNLCINCHEGDLLVFEFPESRSKEYTIVELSNRFVAFISLYFNVKDKIINSFKNETYLMVKENENRRIQR